MIKVKLPNSIWTQAILASLVILLISYVISYPLGSSQKKNNAGQSQTEVLAEPQMAIDKANDYLIKNFDKIQPQQRLALDYLYRKFTLNEQFSAQKTPINAEISDQDTAKEFDSLQRIAYPKMLVKGLGPSPSMFALAANCDHIALPKNIEQIILGEINKGGYELTHAGLGLQIMEELRCEIKDREGLRDQAIEAMILIIDDPKTRADLRFEAVAFLYYMDARERVKTEWVNQLISGQRPDGGWTAGSGSSDDNDHATVLALWALLEHTDTEASNEPLIRSLNSP